MKAKISLGTFGRVNKLTQIDLINYRQIVHYILDYKNTENIVSVQYNIYFGYLY